MIKGNPWAACVLLAMPVFPCILQAHDARAGGAADNQTEFTDTVRQIRDGSGKETQVIFQDHAGVYHVQSKSKLLAKLKKSEEKKKAVTVKVDATSLDILKVK